ncbi:MAG: Glu-tRNA(Gln) amidotransferase subunit GatE [Candidatus Aenigmarchaeota archaeon]|nr:Glu-tRNA(Gln) amidotransferase subunit GatE [Candidatus Aenigmarchaeota archaeon]
MTEAPILKCGLEIHQQLLTKKKLFCDCSAAFSEEPAGEVKRKLRAVAGETGEVDVAAAHEAGKERVLIYKTYPGESCLLEQDEEPPHPMNPEALDIALQIALMLNCTIPEEIEVMRKTVLDGSNTSGFQRTAVVGLDGWIDTKEGRVGIQSVAVEEDACQILDRTKNIFGLSRWGIPLVEIATAPDIKAPEQAAEVAEAIGMVLQSTERVRRGLGTIRQDLNVSITGGARCELKGVQELSTIPKIIEYEMERQSEVIRSGRKVTEDVRRVKPDLTTEFMRPMPGAARMYPETDVPPIRVTREMLSGIRLAEAIDGRLDRFVREHGISADIAGQLFRENHATLFENLVKEGAEPKLAATALTTILKSLKREGAPTEKLGDYRVMEVFRHLGGSANKDSVLQLLKAAAEHPDRNVAELASAGAAAGMSESEVRKEIRAIIAANQQAMKAPNPMNALMGLVMARLRGRAPGALIMRILKEELEG